MKLKVCGMKYQDNIESIAGLQPNFMGFIFYDKSSRYFEGQIPEFSESIKKVGVFVDAALKDVKNTILEYGLNLVQLHGNESPEYCDILRRECHAALGSTSHKQHLKQIQIEVIKVFSIKDHFNFEALKPYENTVDYYLFDTKGKLPGGNGYTFNWDVLNDYPSTKPYFLSGGIGLDELKKIKEFKKSTASKYCFAVDVNSKFEITAGLKNSEELEKFIKLLSF